ncbi:unnamed protein product, partial [Trichogramma brassicae]
MEEVARAEVTKLAAEGFIEQSASDWCSAPVLVKKQDGSYRFCIDYRDLNKGDGAGPVSDSQYERDIRQVTEGPVLVEGGLKECVPSDTDGGKQQEIHTAFAIPGSGLWHYTMMPFGLCNAPRTFQRLIDSLFLPEFEPNIFGYLEDIIVATDTFEEHLQWLEVVLSKLREAGLSVNRKKCEFCCQRLTYLGLVLDAEGLRPDPRTGGPGFE